jgi:hypothetical protein
MTVTVLWVILAASPVPRMALTDLAPVQVSSAEAALFAEQLVQDFASLGLNVVSSRDLATLLGFERQKQLLGCNEESCLAELAGALGVDALLKGDIGKLGEGYALTLKVLNAHNASVVARWNGTVGSVAQLRGLIARGAREIAGQLTATSKGSPTAVDLNRGPEPMSRWWALVPGAVAVGSLVAGGVFQSRAAEDLAALQSATFREDAVQARDDGIRQQNIARVGLVGGGIAVAATVAVLIFGSPSSSDGPMPSVAMGSSGFSFALTWGI